MNSCVIIPFYKWGHWGPKRLSHCSSSRRKWVTELCVILATSATAKTSLSYPLIIQSICPHLFPCSDLLFLQQYNLSLDWMVSRFILALQRLLANHLLILPLLLLQTLPEFLVRGSGVQPHGFQCYLCNSSSCLNSLAFLTLFIQLVLVVVWTFQGYGGNEAT